MVTNGVFSLPTDLYDAWMRYLPGTAGDIAHLGDQDPIDALLDVAGNPDQDIGFENTSFSLP